MDSQTITALAEDGSRYPIDKLEAHVRDVAHLAISVFVSSGDRLLMQRRAKGKYHSGGLWANTCCSHPAWTESIAACARRRLAEELGLTMPLTAIGTIRYRAKVGDLFENELVHCFHGTCDADGPLPPPDSDEVMAVEWRRFDQLAQDVELRPAIYAPWLRLYLKHHRALLDPLFRASDQ